MANIPLRNFQRKIEEMIAGGMIDNALSACQAILEKFPKNFHTYQILGKAFLEKQQLDLADCIFDLVLKIDPDDFVAHIGKSFIRENQDDLPGAIEHMKRAFELEPGNEGLQKEVKRLIQAKDGVAPNNVRLTRGALIKMYLRGELYEQAIAEIKIGLHESPKRDDYRINLAESLYKNGDAITAVQECIEILSEMPYAITANRIMYEILSQNNDTKKDNLYLSRLIELDPYYAFMKPETASVLDIPDVAVLISDSIQPNKVDEINWVEFLEDQWVMESSAQKKAPVIETDWDEIIKSAINDRSDKELDKREESGKKLSLKEKFIDKLKGQPEKDEIEEIDAQYHEWILGEESAVTPATEEVTSSGEKDDITAQPAHSEIENMEENEPEPIIERGEQEEVLNQQESNFEQKRLDDTQKIRTHKPAFHELLEEAKKAVGEGNINYAKKIYRNLIDEKENLGLISSNIEDLINQYPEYTDFFFLLGESYLLQKKKEKALQIFQRAQKYINF